MNDNGVYIVQCTQGNFDDAKYLLQMFCRILEIDQKACSIKTSMLDSTIKKRLDGIGASFWQEPGYEALKTAIGRGV